MKKVLIMTNTLYAGGAERVLQTIFNHLNEEKYDITLCSLHREKIDSTVYKNKFTYKVVFDSVIGKNKVSGFISNILTKIKGKIFNYCSARIFYLLFIHGKFDIEIAFIEGESTKIISGSTNKKSKKVVWVHTDLEKNPWTSFLYKDDEDEKWHYDKFDRVVCVSEATKESFLRKYSIPAHKVITHYNPIDSVDIQYQANTQKVMLEGGKIHIMAVGRLVDQKGFDRLLRVANRLSKENKNIKIHIIGEGEQRTNLEEYINSHNLQSYVELHGYMKNPYSIMKSGDVLVCSSRAEGYSLVIAEAMILGLAIVTTDCSGPYELINGGEYGILTENSEEGIYQGICKILSHDRVLEKYKYLASERSKIFNLKDNIEKFEQIINE